MMQKNRRRRLAKRTKKFMYEKTIPESEDARRIAFQIHDLDQDNKLNAGEMFNFFKWSYIFK